MPYKVSIHRGAQKQFLSFPSEAQVAIGKAIDELEEDSRPTGCKKLRETDLWRIRTGRYRIVYLIDDQNETIMVVKVAIRSEGTYRRL